ncbi:MAG: FAD-dependent oxidoreductase [Deltaproteobacteria bacterium]|nr:FAD-dependent oxidoreductase [bacterium]MCB9477395.1 FAD-dependent oxidoreductase [Deltaproteobacteria bacterium]MCB9487900.1 FAD-dependent oxidoreductase [Deltaproteobacteria bacterium]
MSQRFVVIGGQAAGMSAASQARRRDPKADVVVFEGSEEVSYLACGLPYYLGGVVQNEDDLIVVSKDTFVNNRNIDVRTGHFVESIDVAARRLRVVDRKSGAASDEAFDTLCISTGATATPLAVPGQTLDGVFTLHTLGDARRIQQYIETNKVRTAVIVGAGYIGLEMAENLRRRGIGVAIVERLDSVMSGVGWDIGQPVARALAANSVRLMLDTEIDAFDGDTRVRVCRTRSEDLDADLVIIATGIKPNSGIAIEAGLASGAAGAISVDDHQETSISGIYAAGDCADSLNLVTGKKNYLALGTIANKQGRVAGANAVGGDETFLGVVGTRIVRVFDVEVARAGLTLADAKEHGYRAASKTIKSYSRANYYPQGGQVMVKIIFDTSDGRLLGAEVVGPEGVKGRIDVFVAALTHKMTVGQFSDLDLAYAPPFSPVWDPVLVASNVAKRGLRPRRSSKD